MTHGYSENCRCLDCAVIRAALRTKHEQQTAISAAKPDMVNHPPHYKKGGIEVIDIMKAKMGQEHYEGYLWGNIIKYIMRWQDKNGLEDLRKAQTYLEYLIRLQFEIEKENPS